MSNLEYIRELAPETEDWVHEQLADDMDRRDAEIERLKDEIETYKDTLQMREEQIGFRNNEIERLQRKMMIVWNFPSHPGGHPADQSADAMVEEDWRHGWICAVEALQEAITDGT